MKEPINGAEVSLKTAVSGLRFFFSFEDNQKKPEATTSNHTLCFSPV